MLILRAVGLILLVGIAVCVAGFLLTGDVRYRRWTGILMRLGIAAALVFLAVLLLERLIAPVL